MSKTFDLNPRATEPVIPSVITKMEYIVRVEPTGSFYICEPPVTDTDEDYVMLTNSMNNLLFDLRVDGWVVCEHDAEYPTENREIEFCTARKDKLNLIIFDDDEGFWAFSTATTFAKMMNLTSKVDRIALFQAVCGYRRKGEDNNDVESL